MTSENQPQTDISDATGYRPKDIVLAKVKGYPPWPAMVLEETILPDHIKAKKPKTVIIPPKKKHLKPAYIIPVRFFSDDTYIWIKSSDIKPLELPGIEAHLAIVKRRKDGILDSAYELAKSPPDMELFVKYGSKGEPSDVLEDDFEDFEQEIEQKVVKKPKTAKVKKATKAAAKPIKKAPTEQKKLTKEPEEEDSDWGIDEDIKENYKLGNYIYDDEQEQIEFMEAFPTSEQLTKEHNTKAKEFNKLSKPLLQKLVTLVETDDGDISGIIEEMAILKTKTVPKTVILKSKLLKSLILVNRTVERKKLNGKINDLLQVWVGYSIDINPEEPEPEPEPEPETEPQVQIIEIDTPGELPIPTENGINGH